MPYNQELSLAIAAAEQAGTLQLALAGTFVPAERKDDRSPVTDVDRRCEALIRDRLLSGFPADGFMGEESGSLDGRSGRRWIVDPLDGTRPFLRNIPTYGALIALEEAGNPVVGVIHLPAMKTTCWAAAGGGAFLNGKPIHVSAVRSLAAAMGTALGYVEKAGETSGRQLFALMRAWDYTYGFMDAYSYVCVASGRLDVAVNILDKPWDCASGACIVREAGGLFSDIAGNQTVHNGSIILSNGLLHDAALAFFKDRSPPSRA